MRKLILLILLIPSICWGYNGNTSTAIWFQMDRTLRIDLSVPYSQTSEGNITATATLAGYDFDAGDSIGWYNNNTLIDTDTITSEPMQKSISLNLQQDNVILAVTVDNQGNTDTGSVTVTQINLVGNASEAIWFQIDYDTTPSYTFNPEGLSKNEILADWATYYDIDPKSQTGNEIMGIIYTDEGITRMTFNEFVRYINNLY